MYHFVWETNTLQLTNLERVWTSSNNFYYKNHYHFVEPIGQIFIDLHPKHVVQCIDGSILTTTKILSSIELIHDSFLGFIWIEVLNTLVVVMEGQEIVEPINWRMHFLVKHCHKFFNFNTSWGHVTSGFFLPQEGEHFVFWNASRFFFLVIAIVYHGGGKKKGKKQFFLLVLYVG